MLGFTCVAVGLGALGGSRWGPKGAAAGAIAGGAVVNAARALLYAFKPQAEAKKEAIVSGTWALLCGGIAGYLIWHVRAKASVRPNEKPRCATENGARRCGIRPV